MLFASAGDEAAHEPVEVAHQIVGSEGKLGFGHHFHCALLEKQCEERPDQGKGKQREEYRDQVEHEVKDDGGPVGLHIGQDAGEGFLLLWHGGLVFVIGILVEELALKFAF